MLKNQINLIHSLLDLLIRRAAMPSFLDINKFNYILTEEERQLKFVSLLFCYIPPASAGHCKFLECLFL